MIANSDIRIEQASIDDRSVLIELFYELLQYMDEFDCLILPTRENAIFFTDHFFIPAVLKQDPILIAWKGSKAIGLCGMSSDPLPYQVRWKMGLLMAYYVRQDYRGCNVGTQLFQLAARRLKELKVHKILLEPYLKDKELVSFYHRLGFVPFGEIAIFTL